MSNNANVAAAIKEVAHKVFGGYAELLRMPHTARFSIGSVIACMPFPMVGMTITISVQHYYGNYSLAGVLTAIQAIALAVSSPLLGKLVDKFGQRQVSIPTILVWIVAAIALTTSITNRAPVWVLYCLTPFLAAIPPWGAMSRARWTTMLKGDRERTDRALSLSGVFDECMWIIGNPLASTLAVISGLLAFSFTGVCVVIGALMFLTELTTEPKSQTQLAREAGLTREEYRKREAAKAQRMRERDAAERPRPAATMSRPCGRRRPSHRRFPRRQEGVDLGAGPDRRVRNLVQSWRVPVGVEHLDHRVRHRSEHEAIHRFRVRMLLVQLAMRRTGVRREELDHPAVEALLLLPHRGESRRGHVHVRQASVGDHDHLPADRRLPGTHVDQRQSADAASGASHAIHRRRGVDGRDELDRLVSRSAIAGVFIDHMGSHGGFLMATVLAITSLAIAFVGFRQIKSSTETPTLTEVSV